MTGTPISPRLLKGALVGVDLFNPLASIIVFQYNPDTMTRRLEPRSNSGEGERSEPFRLTGPPKETISLSVEIDATDQIADGNPVAVATGISPTLSALEMLVYPKSALVLANAIIAGLGGIEVLSAEGPMVLLVWGPTRVLPVRIASISITEEAFDPLLNPIRAKVELSLNVLSYHDLKFASPGGALFMVHQITKELMATTNIFNSAANVGAGLKL